MTDSSPTKSYPRREFSEAEIGDRATEFGRWRLACPYGLWTCADGREVLFNRYYRPVYQRYPGQPAQTADPTEWVPHVSQQYFFNDGNAPVSYYNVPRRDWLPIISRIDAVLTSWGLNPLPPRPTKPPGSGGGQEVSLKSARGRAWRNTLCAAINAGLEQNLFGLQAKQNWWPEAANTDHHEAPHGGHHIFEFSIDSIPGLGYVRDIGWEELSIHAALWPTVEARKWIICGYSGSVGPLTGEVFATGWLERLKGSPRNHSSTFRGPERRVLHSEMKVGAAWLGAALGASPVRVVRVGPKNFFGGQSCLKSFVCRCRCWWIPVNMPEPMRSGPVASLNGRPRC
jgi:hypothetical protein